VDSPHGRVFVPLCAGDLGAEADMPEEVVLLRATLHVVEDLRLRRPFPRPIGFLFEREAVGKRRYVAGCAGIGIVAPGTAEPIGLFEDSEGIDSQPGELDAQAEAGEAGADDRNLACRCIFHGYTETVSPFMSQLTDGCAFLALILCPIHNKLDCKLAGDSRAGSRIVRSKK
jgi:hypothetical protein